MECFVIIVNGLKPLTIITKHFILDVAATLDPPLKTFNNVIAAELKKEIPREIQHKVSKRCEQLDSKSKLLKADYRVG